MPYEREVLAESIRYRTETDEEGTITRVPVPPAFGRSIMDVFDEPATLSAPALDWIRDTPVPTLDPGMEAAYEEEMNAIINGPECACGDVGCIQDSRLRGVSLTRRTHVFRQSPWRESAEALQLEAPFADGAWTPTDPMVNLHMVIPKQHRTPNLVAYVNSLRVHADTIASTMGRGPGIRDRLDMGSVEATTLARWNRFKSDATWFVPGVKRSLLPGDASVVTCHPSSRDYADMVNHTYPITGTPPPVSGAIIDLAMESYDYSSERFYLANVGHLANPIPSQAALLELSAQAVYALGFTTDRCPLLPSHVYISESDARFATVVFAADDGVGSSTLVPIVFPNLGRRRNWRTGTYHFDLGWLAATVTSLHGNLPDRM